LKFDLCHSFIVVGALCVGIQTDLNAGQATQSYSLAGSIFAEQIDEPNTGEEEGSSFFSSLRSMHDWPKEKKVFALNVATVSTIAAIGVAGWDYGSHSFRTANEGWFDSDTPYGGADKLGHTFTCYALASFYNRLYRDWGYSDNDAILLGAGNSLLTMSLIEVGDGFSKSEGFSWQDEIMNSVGAGVAYLRHRFPAVRDRVDFRWEWFPSPAARKGDRFDVFTDYSGQKFLLAFKLGGWLQTDNPILKALEVQVGYYTRGYVSGDDDYFDGKHRYGYVGIGLNMTYVLEKLTHHRAKGVFDYIQVPYTYISPSAHRD
jgi:hypothetical protein